MKVITPLLFLLSSTFAANITTVHQFPNGTWLENIALTRNASLLVTLIGSAVVHIVHPTTSTANLVASFPNANAVLGITETSPDVFAVAVGTYPPNTTESGSYSIWTIDLSCQGPIKPEKIADLKNMQVVNGITRLNAHALLLADSYAGNIVKLDLRTKQYDVVLTDKTLESDFSNTALPIGVNGVRLHGAYLYYTNTVQNLLGRVKVDVHTGKAVGAFETIASGAHISQPDDFAVLPDGSVILVRPIADTLQHVTARGKVELQERVAGGTSVVLAKGKKEKVVYVSTSGLDGGVSKEGGRVVKVEF